MDNLELLDATVTMGQLRSRTLVSDLRAVFQPTYVSGRPDLSNICNLKGYVLGLAMPACCIVGHMVHKGIEGCTHDPGIMS